MQSPREVRNAEISVTKRQLAGSKVRGGEVYNGKTGGLCPNVGYKGAMGTWGETHPLGVVERCSEGF